MKKGKGEEPKKQILGRVSSHLKMGIVGLPNVGKSSLFNLLTKTEAKAENYPFCTIEPNLARVPLPDERFNFLCDVYKPGSKVPTALEVWDIAGLVPGASEGLGLGNAFLANISAVDGIFHVVRVFDDKDVTHTEGEVDPLRDLDIIAKELRLKDIAVVKKRREPIARRSNADPKLKPELDFLDKLIAELESGKDAKMVDWNIKEIEMLNPLYLLTSKPSVYLINMSEKAYIRQRSPWLRKIFAWVQDHSPDSKILPFALTLEEQVFPLSPQDATAFLEEKKTKSQLDKIIQSGFEALQLMCFFTAGQKEVRAWPLQIGTLAPRAAGTIHGDFEKCFIKAMVMKYDDLKENTEGSRDFREVETKVKALGKYRAEGKKYIVEDGDVMLFMHNATK